MKEIAKLNRQVKSFLFWARCTCSAGRSDGHVSTLFRGSLNQILILRLFRGLFLCPSRRASYLRPPRHLATEPSKQACLLACLLFACHGTGQWSRTG